MRASRLRAIRDYRCARWIQTVARGKRDRDYVKEKRFRLWMVQHERVLAACLHIQRVARGKAGRIAARETLKRRIHAINIQRVWKGYITRKELLNVYALRYGLCLAKCHSPCECPATIPRALVGVSPLGRCFAPAHGVVNVVVAAAFNVGTEALWTACMWRT